jgi:membrane-bound lytic murein transglycosylase D
MPDSDQSAEYQQRSPTLTRLLPLASALLLGGCLTQGTRTDHPADTATLAPAPAPAVARDRSPLRVVRLAAQAPADPADLSLWARLRAGFRLSDVTHPRIDAEIRRLQRSPSALRGLMQRAEPFLHHVLNATEAAGLPAELALLPAIESGFQPHVYSPDGAAGLWQFMPATGRSLGLDQDWWFDKRRTVRASTRAALVYLEHLNRRFGGDWLHSLAAYNAGAATVSRAIRRAERRGEPTDFWSLDLPGETDRYVPRLLALAAIIRDPAPHRLELPEIHDRPYFVAVATAGQIDLNIAADLAGVPVEHLLALNAGHKRWATHPDGPHELLLPIETIDRFQSGLAALPPERRLRFRHYKVRRGDTLSRIAHDHGVSVETIQQANGLTGSQIRAGAELQIPLSDARAVTAVRGNRFNRQRLRYQVRAGDSLYTIAQRFQVSVADLKRWNRVGRFIHPGDALTVYVDPDA